MGGIQKSALELKFEQIMPGEQKLFESCDYTYSNYPCTQVRTIKTQNAIIRLRLQ